MKWIRHNSNSHRNLKFQGIIKRFGWKGYGLYWICCELVAEQGNNYRILASKSWKNYLKKTSSISDKKLNEFLTALAEANLISQKALKDGDLAIPKMKDYSDDYTKQLRRKAEQTSKKLSYDTTRHDTTRNDTTHVSFIERKMKEFKERNKSIFKKK